MKSLGAAFLEQSLRHCAPSRRVSHRARLLVHSEAVPPLLPNVFATSVFSPNDGTGPPEKTSIGAPRSAVTPRDPFAALDRENRRVEISRKNSRILSRKNNASYVSAPIPIGSMSFADTRIRNGLLQFLYEKRNRLRGETTRSSPCFPQRARGFYFSSVGGVGFLETPPKNFEVVGSKS